VKDENGKASTLVTADSLYPLDWWAGQSNPAEWIEAWIRLIKRWRPGAWFGTKGVLRHALEGTMRREARLAKAWVRMLWLSDIKNKSAKGKPFQEMAEMGRVIFPRESGWHERVISNCVAFPTGTHDDGFDTMANACRAMGEIPEAFAAKPKKPKPSDSWVVIGGEGGRKRAWKTA
jgi:predicted phage terminase large subunit-like protein